MTNVQLLLSIAIPCLMILLAMYNSNTRSERIKKRFDGIDARLDQHDRKFEEIKESGHRDALEIMRQMTARHERVAVVETKQAK
jgi:uncharacterized protein YfbU (UPF0304 family)